ncbi:MAG: molybdenum cofactor biosynthesis protein MoaE [Gemmatimonadaceae bacterium]
MRSAIVTQAIHPTALLEEVSAAANGAAVLFVGTVRDVSEGRSVQGIEYSAYVAMAERELAAIVQEASDRYATSCIVAEHRVGVLELGEASVAIAAAHVHRAEAFDAARFVIEQIKKRLPVWKREHFADGGRDWVDPTRRAAGLVR